MRNVLRIGAAGLLFLETPGHAAVATAVALTKARGLAPFAGLVNAVLRKVAAAGPAVLADLDSPSPGHAILALGAPGDCQRPRHCHGAPDRGAAGPLRSKPGTEPPEGGTVLPTGSVRFPAGTRVADVGGFETGVLWVQDAAAALPARLLDARAGERVADLCAAPGGKTGQLAAAGAIVTAVERDSARAGRLVANSGTLESSRGRDNRRRDRLDA